MLSGLKFIPRDQIDDKTQDDKSDTRKSHKKKKNKSRHDSSSDDDGSQRIKKRSKKKWYSSEEDDDDSASYSDSGTEEDTRKGKESRKRHKSKKSRRKSKRKGYTSDESDDENDDKKKGKGRSEKSDIDGNGGSVNDNENIIRKEMGLEWMLRPKEEDVKPKSVPASSLPEESPANEVCFYFLIKSLVFRFCPIKKTYVNVDQLLVLNLRAKAS
nr:hypothetical protein [Tanacetum cinerariifolium]